MLEPSSFPFSRALYAPPPLRGARKSAKRLIYTQFMRPRNNSLLSLSYVCVKTVIMCVCVCFVVATRTHTVCGSLDSRACEILHARTHTASIAAKICHRHAAGVADATRCHRLRNVTAQNSFSRTEVCVRHLCDDGAME